MSDPSDEGTPQQPQQTPQYQQPQQAQQYQPEQQYQQFPPQQPQQAQQPQFPPQVPVPGAPPDNNLGWAIASLIVCWPFGIPSIIKATEVQNLWARGWQQHAEHSAAEAKKWGKIGVIVGASLVALYIIGLLLYFVFLFAVLVPNAH